MNESQARTVLIVRAFEAQSTPHWSEADADAVTREAARDVGEAASPTEFLTRRADIAANRLAERDPLAAAALRSGISSIGSSLAFVAIVIAFGIGFASDSVGANGRINILAPPLLAIVAWNLVVYLAMAAARLRRGSTTPHPLRRWLIDRLQRWTTLPRHPTGPWLRFVGDWTMVSRPLQAQRIGGLLHGGAVAFACGALASLYLRGLAFEFRAGWDSTFLSAGSVHDWLSMLLGPASALTGIELPATPALEALRFSVGNGENAARWIHLYAVTVGALVILPRLAFAALAIGRARRLTSAFPMDLRAPYFQRLIRGRSGLPMSCRLLPYGHRPEAPAIEQLTRLVEHGSGQRAALRVLPMAEQGAEDDIEALARDLGEPGSPLLVLFKLSATPERETHGCLLDSLRAVDPRSNQVVIVDETSFKQRFGIAMPNRIVERREAWTRMLREVGRKPVFVDLASDAAGLDEATLADAFELLAA